MKVLLTAEQLHEGVDRIASEVAEFYADRPLTIVGILTGSIVLMADLIRRIDMPLRVGLVQASSYRGSATEPGALTLNLDLLPDIQGRDVLFVDDIFDTGKTLLALIEQLKNFKPTSVRTAVLLRKHGRKAVAIEPDHVAFEIPNAFVVGYGLDYHDAYRNLPYLGALEDHEIAGSGH